MKIIGILALFLMLTGVGRADPERPVALQGTFLQMWSSHRAWEAQDWDMLFDCLTALRLNELVIQFSKIDNLSLLQPTKNPRRPSPIQTVLRLARQHGFKVWIGLYADLKYFENVQKGPRQLGGYLTSLRARSLALARQLHGTLGQDPSFAGWYLSEEIHDESFSDPERKQHLLTHLAVLGHQLRRLDPGKKIGISGFSNGTLPAGDVARFWQDLLAATPIDTVFFQDGIGARKLGFQNLPGLLSSVRTAVTGQGRELRVVVETFRERPDDQGRFTAQPAPWDELRRQLAVAGAVSGGGLVAFSAPEYMCPRAGALAKTLFDQYRAGLHLDR